MSKYESIFGVSRNYAANATANAQFPDGLKMDAIKPRGNYGPAWIQVPFCEDLFSKQIKSSVNVW
jgi:hypothetical protein